MKNETGSPLEAFIPKLILLGGIIPVLTFGKILWLLIYSQMQREHVGFLEGVSQHWLPSLGLAGLVSAIVIGYFWARSRYVK